MTISEKNKTIDKTQIWQNAIANDFAIALWRLPLSSEKHLLIDVSGKPIATKIDLEELPAGFAFSPFVGDSLFLKADIYYRYNANNELIEDTFSKENPFLTAPMAIEALAQPSHFEENTIPLNAGRVLNPASVSPNYSDTTATARKNNKTSTSPFSVNNHHIPNTKEAFVALVTKGIEAIKSGVFQKIVPSRTKNIQLPHDFEVVEAFDKLCAKYPNAFVSAVYLPEIKTVWMGATPETLVSSNAKGIFKTMALAGTQSVIEADGSLLSPAEARWSHKEIEEQALVCRYIIECFKKIRLREYVEVGPKTILAGNLLHLRSDYTVDTQAVNFPQLGTVMLELLHPTSAVCGMPKEPSIQFLKENEPHERGFFSGFLGPVNILNTTDLFVNIRCMKIENREATLFAGVGVTEDSIPVKEWQESEIKTQTLLNVIL